MRPEGFAPGRVYHSLLGIADPRLWESEEAGGGSYISGRANLSAFFLADGPDLCIPERIREPCKGDIFLFFITHH